MHDFLNSVLCCLLYMFLRVHYVKIVIMIFFLPFSTILLLYSIWMCWYVFFARIECELSMQWYSVFKSDKK